MNRMNNRVAVFSDLHLGVHQNSSYWVDIALKWAEWLKTELNNRNIDTIIFCGDFFHHRDEVNLTVLDAANKFLNILEGFNIFMIPGNHDCYYKETSEINSLSIFKGRKGITVFDELITVDFNKSGKSFTFCPWGTKLGDIPNSDVIFGHFEFQNFKMNAHTVCEYGEDPANIIDKSKLIISGHFHLRCEKSFDGSLIVYVGNPFQMDFNDCYSRKGFYILSYDDTPRCEFIENSNTPKHIKINLSALIQLEDPEKVFVKSLPGNLIKLTVDKNISTEHLDALVAKLSSYKPEDVTVEYDVNYNKIKLDNPEEYDVSGVSIESAIEEFVNMLDIENKKEVILYTINLLQKARL